MDPKVYEEFALSLEAPADNDCIMRIKAQALQFGEILNTLSKVGSKADKLKKLAFYGKSLTKQQRQPVLKLDMENALDRFDEMLKFSDNARLLHAWIGLLSEASEIGNAIMIHLITGDPIDLRNINEELGDAQWYIPIGANAIGTTLEQVQVDNYVKLDKKRYSSGKFNAEEADPANRDTEHEVSHIKAEKVVQTKTVIACPHCNAQFTEPEDDRGGPPRPDDEIQCPDCKRMYPAHKFMSVVPRHPITIEASDKVMSTPYATSDVVILQPGYEDQHEPFLYTCHACGQRTDVACAMERLLQGQIIGCPMCGEAIKLPVKQG